MLISTAEAVPWSSEQATTYKSSAAIDGVLHSVSANGLHVWQIGGSGVLYYSQFLKNARCLQCDNVAAVDILESSDSGD